MARRIINMIILITGFIAIIIISNHFVISLDTVIDIIISTITIKVSTIIITAISVIGGSNTTYRNRGYKFEIH